MKRLFLLLILITIFSFTGATAQTLSLNTYGVSLRDVANDTTNHFFTSRYNGLLNVGRGTKMYFKASVDGGDLTSPVWTILEKPAGSAAAFGAAQNVDASTQLITLIPDSVGTYKISVTSGAMADTLVINSALYLGVNSSEPNCETCHNNPLSIYQFYDKWSGTHHSYTLKDGLDGVLSSHFSSTCLQCHTTGNDAGASNNGFDDFPFVYPSSMHTGVYDSLTAVYPDAMQRANVQCEACHGPGSGHNALISDSRMVYSLSAAVCSYCHDSGTHYVIGDQWKYSGQDASEFDGRGFEGGHAKGAYVISAGTRSGCSPCHSGAGFIEWVKEGRPLDNVGSPAATTILPEATNITCAVCHDPHDAANEHQLRIASVTTLGDGTEVTFAKYGTGALCMQCHRSRRQASTYADDPDNASSHYGAHHGPEADLLLGVNAPNFGVQLPSSPHAVAVLPGEDHTNACVNCHMAGPALDANNNPNLVGGHSWNMNDAEGHDNVGACAPCHGDIGTSFKDKKYYINGNADLDGNGVEEGLQVEVKGLWTKLADLLPHNESGDVELTPGDSTLTPAITRGAYVYFWIEEDRSWGIHNPAYAVSLLKVAIEQLGGVVAVDYPKDNMPQEYKLAQNYPNPFNPSTTIQYTIPEHSMVTLTVYDALGKEIEQLYSGEKAPGTYSVQWNASNYSSGIYFYRLTADKFVQVKKMLLLK